SHHRQDQSVTPFLVAGGLIGRLSEIFDVDVDFADAPHVDAAHRVAVDRGLVESGHGPLGHPLLGAHQSLRLGDGDAYRPWRHRRGRYPGLLLFHRTHKRASLPQGPNGRRPLSPAGRRLARPGPTSFRQERRYRPATARSDPIAPPTIAAN